VIEVSEVRMLRRIPDAYEARACIKAAKASGRTMAEWARAHGVDGRSLNAWRLNLERSERAGSEVRLVELVAVPPVPACRRPDPTTRYAVQVGEFAVEVDAGFDDDVLRRLIAVVASC
jgi:hypothetical protein